MKTLLIGATGDRNLGDEALAYFALKKYKKAVVMTNDSEFLEEFCGKKINHLPFFPAGCRSLLKFIFSLKKRKQYSLYKFRRIIFYGGGLFAIKFRAYLLWAFQFFLAKKFYPKAEFYFLNQGIDETKNIFKKIIVKFVFSQAKKISMRDTKSKLALKEVGIVNCKVEEDLVFYSLQLATKRQKKSKIILLNCQNRCFFDNKNVLNSAILRNYQNKGYKLKYLCFHPQDAKNIPREFEGKVVFPRTFVNLVEEFSEAEIALGQRLHFLIFAHKFCNKTFCLGKPYSQKVSEFITKHQIPIVKK